MNSLVLILQKSGQGRRKSKWQFLHKTAKTTVATTNADAQFVSTLADAPKNLPTGLCPKNNRKIFIASRMAEPVP